jgi:F-type H+-transporting ATPase subunit b
MNELITTFHIDWKLIIAQLVNFAIILFVLKKFAYKPVMNLMDDRAKKIEKGLKDAEESQKKLAGIIEKEKEVLTKARKEAQDIIAKAEVFAVKNKEEIIEQANVQSEKIMADTEKKIELEKNKMFAEVKTQVADLIVAATGKIINEKMDTGKDKELIEKAIK